MNEKEYKYLVKELSEISKDFSYYLIERDKYKIFQKKKIEKLLNKKGNTTFSIRFDIMLHMTVDDLHQILSRYRRKVSLKERDKK